ncbi:MAG: hypothetical protein ACREJO_09070 [Phycisphaerales bacterium]
MDPIDFNPSGGANQPPLTAHYPGGLVQQPSAWPKVVGIIGIVVSSMGLLTNVCGGIYYLVQGKFTSMMPQPPGGSPGAEMNQAILDATAKYTPVNVAIAAVGSLVAAACLYGSILTLRRSPACMMMRWWAIAAVIFIIGATIVQAIEQSEMMGVMAAEMTKASAAGTAPGMAGAMNAMSGVAIVISALYGIARLVWPTFVLVWFCRPKVRDEIESWRVPASGSAM